MNAGPSQPLKIAGAALLLLLVAAGVARCARDRTAGPPMETPSGATEERIREPERLPEPAGADKTLAAEVPADVMEESTADLCRRLAERIRAGESPETVAMSAELVRRGDEAVDGLEQMLRSGDRNDEIAALRLLIRIGTPRALAAGLVRLCQAPGSDAQDELREVFGNAGSPAVAAAVVDMAAREERPEERRNLRAVVAAMEGSAVVEALAERIQGEENEERLRPWLELLAGLSRPSNVPALENALLDDARPEVQEAAAAALAGIGDSRACRLLAEFGADVPACRDALARVQSPYAETALRDIAVNDPDAGVRAAAQKALERREQ